MKIENGKLYAFGRKPMKVMAESESSRFLIASRRVNKREENTYFRQMVAGGAYKSFTEAYNALKETPVYAIIDFEKGFSGRSNVLFDDTDYFDPKSCQEAIKKLESGEMGVSEVNWASLEIEKRKTLDEGRQEDMERKRLGISNA